MASLEINEIESQLDNRLLFNLRLNGDAGRFDLPIGIMDHGSSAANETAVLNGAVAIAEQLAATARQKLNAAPAAPPATG
jgi:hypothetical protein